MNGAGGAGFSRTQNQRKKLLVNSMSPGTLMQAAINSQAEGRESVHDSNSINSKASKEGAASLVEER